LVFEIDPRFAAAADGQRSVAKVTFLDEGSGAFAVDSDAGSSSVVERTGSGTWRTATIALPDGAVGADATRLRISVAAGHDDLVVRFVRIIPLG
jgi:hypothetical protein